MDALTEIARAVLYEGYILWPYRRTAIKNQQRWTFGGVYPGAFAAKSGGSDRAVVRTECLAEANAGARLDVRIRFLHVVARQVMALQADHLIPIDQLTIGAERFLSWDEATEREWAGYLVLKDGPVTDTISMTVDGGKVEEPLRDVAGEKRGALIRSWESLHAEIAVTAIPSATGIYRLSVDVRNTTPWKGDHRPDAMRHTLVSIHTVLRLERGEFISLTDPPERFAAESSTCRNDGMWPVLVGNEGARDTILASPIILYDYPRIAPESPGDMFDGGEIDQMLILNVLTMSEAEQQEMRDSDPRAREILDRCTTMSRDELMRLHGTIRSIRPLTEAEPS